MRSHSDHTISCADCDGEGFILDKDDEEIECETCEGTGRVTDYCPHCQGSGGGMPPEWDCRYCRGTGYAS